MRLRKIFETQKKFQHNFFDPDKLSEEDKIYRTKETLLALHREVDEVLDTIPWKQHRDNSKFVKSQTATIEEIIDCFKYVINLCIIWGISDNKFMDEFNKKSNIVQKRYDDEHKK